MNQFEPPRYQSWLKYLTEHPLILLAILFAIAMLFPDMAHATSSSGMPWESPLNKLVKSITGPVAFGISILAIVAAMAGLLFGGELSGLIKTLLFLAVGISVVVFAANVLSSLFNVSSTLVT